MTNTMPAPDASRTYRLGFRNGPAPIDDSWRGLITDESFSHPPSSHVA